MTSAAKRRIEIEPYENPMRWVLTFNDIMTLLLTFFVLVLSMSSLDRRALTEAHRELATVLGGRELLSSETLGTDEIGRIIETFKIVPGRASETVRGALRRDPDDASLNALAEALRDVFNVPVFDEGGDRFERDTVIGTTHKYRGVIDKRYFEPGIAVVRERRGVVLRLPAGIVFDSGDAVVKQSAYGIVDAVGAVLARTDLQVSVEGHTDAVPVGGAPFASNWELSVARAANVAQYLIERHAVAPERIGIAGYADTVPIAANDTPQQRELNRRVEIVFLRR